VALGAPVGSPSGLLEAPRPPRAPPDAPATSPGQRAYLQSLDRSSRAWVLASGRSPSSEEACGIQQESNIWYNPIPEEEDTGGPRREKEIWRSRDETAKRTGSAQRRSGEVPLEGANPSVGHHTDDITTGNTGRRLHPLSSPGPLSLSASLFQCLMSLVPVVRSKVRMSYVYRL